MTDFIIFYVWMIYKIQAQQSDRPINPSLDKIIESSTYVISVPQIIK
jgi:hypothetical protein